MLIQSKYALLFMVAFIITLFMIYIIMYNAYYENKGISSFQSITPQVSM
jgi:hypothetical protein